MTDFRRTAEYAAADLEELASWWDALPPSFTSKVSRHANGCWLWQAYTDRGGYGRYRSQLAHRWAYMQTGGCVPAGLDLDHLCRTRHCVNPTHLEPVTRQTNVDRGLKARRTHCKHGHAFDSANTYIHPKYGSQECRRCRAIAEHRRHERKRAEV